MRDGNSACRVKDYLDHVVSLPMRDGNVWYVALTASRRFVVSLPMRDGNWNTLCNRIEHHHVVSLP